MEKPYTGVLIGWKRQPTLHGIVLTMQVAESAEQFTERSWSQINIALNERQLRSLARDLERAATERGIELHAKRSVLRRLTRG
jgi:hypothetical protein